MASPSNAPTREPSRPPPAEDCLLLDAQTLKDLEIFEAQPGGRTLFDFCNLTRNKGGARVLRRRMERPSARAEQIRATQDSLAFIVARRQAFGALPSLVHTGPVAAYLDDILPVVTATSLLEFTFGALELWISHDRHYSRIVRGVQVSCALVRQLRRFVAEQALSNAPGELGPLLEELRALLALPRFARLPDEETGGWGAWRVLRVDQVLRLHEKAALGRLLQLVFEIDALVALADTGSRHGLVLPTVEEGPLGMQAEGLVHPLLEQAVGNPLRLDQNRRVLFLTGPNMAGKTTYLRACATALYFAHLGMGVPASSFRFRPAQRLFSSITLSDDLRNGVSYFRAEALRVKAVAEAVAAGLRVVALMDEPFKGTNVKDALDASTAVLERFATKQDCLFLFSSHLIEMSESLLGNAQVDCRHFEAEEGEQRLRFSYVLRPGISSQRLGLRVLREEGIFDLLDGAGGREGASEAGERAALGR